MTALAGWQNFYVIVGSSAGALVGLQFVALSLISGRATARPADPEAGKAFSTPTIIHFATVLVLAAILSAPWEGTDGPAVVCGLTGISGVVYAIIITLRIHRQNAYQSELEDWLFHALFPIASYLLLAVSACLTRVYPQWALFGIGASALLLLLIGIHNAWDAVTYHVFVKAHGKSDLPTSASI